MNGYTIDGTIQLSPEEVDRANSHSHFEAGTAIAQGAQEAYVRFFCEFPLDMCDGEEQREYLEERVSLWRDLVTKCYSEQITNRANFVPVNVAGSAGYDTKKFDKMADRNLLRCSEHQEKMDKFIKNTRDGYRKRRPIGITLEGLKKGKYHREPIMSNDPYAIEKLNAKLECLVKLQDTMKYRNAYYKKHGTFAGITGYSDEEARAMDMQMEDYSGEKKPYTSFTLSNNNQQIKAIKHRLVEIKNHQEGAEFQAVRFEGGELVVNREIDRLQFLFDGKPSEEVRTIMKGHAFKWARTQGAWQRQWTKNAEISAKSALKKMQELEVGEHESL